jgi:hypothetical protein
MKTIVPFKQRILKFVLLVSVMASGVLAQAQTSAELKFENSSLFSGSAGADGAVYKFPLVNNDLDALMTITGRSSALVTINNIDNPGQGFPKAFQPQIKYNNGNVNSPTTWWMEFKIQFVVKNTTNPAIINNFYATGLDIDGNDDKLKEWDSFYGGTSYTLENNTQLVVSSLLGTINLPTLPGKQFLGTIIDHAGIDTSATELMTTVYYVNTSSMIIRLGATTTGSASNANRNYSVWFKNFTYSAPQTLPVKLELFSATLSSNSNKADLRWVTSSEMNVSHFVVEKSTDGANYSEAGIVFAYGNSTTTRTYTFTDELANNQAAIIYYRLRSVDIDGKSQYSETRIIRIGKKSESYVTIFTYPNPANNELRITVPSNWQSKRVVYELFSANGQTAKRTENASSSQTETLNISALAPGFYIVRVTCNGETAQQKIIKQ